MSETSKDVKRVTGLYGEMRLAMELHSRGWQVYRAYIDEHVDFVVGKYYCINCKTYSELERRKLEGKSKSGKTFPTDLCNLCKQKSLRILFRNIQSKASEGVEVQDKQYRNYSFHAKLRSNIEDRSYYAWIALIDDGESVPTPHFYIFHHSEIAKFDNLSLPSYQKTDNQKTTLRIDNQGRVLNKARYKDRDYNLFNTEFYMDNGFNKLDKIYPYETRLK